MPDHAASTDQSWLAGLALALVEKGVRNSRLEELHAGKFPASAVGDYSDVTVVTPYGEIPWAELSRICDEEMKGLMSEVVDRVYTVLTHPGPFLPLGAARAWDRPTLDPAMMTAVARHQARQDGLPESEIWRTWPLDSDGQRDALRHEHRYLKPGASAVLLETPPSPEDSEPTPDTLRALAEAPIADAAWIAKARQALAAGAQAWERAELQLLDEIETAARAGTD